jgi:hypothetical protein
MIFLRQVVLLSLISWSLILPPQIQGEHGDAVAGSTPQGRPFEWGSYDTKKACEEDRTRYLDDRVIGARMRGAGCVMTGKPHTRLSTNYEYCPQ